MTPERRWPPSRSVPFFGSASLLPSLPPSSPSLPPSFFLPFPSLFLYLIKAPQTSLSRAPQASTTNVRWMVKRMLLIMMMIPIVRTLTILNQSYTNKGIWRRGIDSIVRHSCVSTLCPVVIRPYLCISEMMIIMTLLLLLLLMMMMNIMITNDDNNHDTTTTTTTTTNM